jgi:hypothetical protein
MPSKMLQTKETIKEFSRISSTKPPKSSVVMAGIPVKIQIKHFSSIFL